MSSETIISFAYREEIVLLGSCLTLKADSQRSAEFTLGRAWQHWIQRRPQLCHKRIPLLKRIQRYYNTVAATALHGLEWVPLTQSIAKAIKSTDWRCLRSMLCLIKRSDENWVAFKRRQNGIIRKILQDSRTREVMARLLQKQHRWAGHVTRLDSKHLAAQWAQAWTLEECHLSQWLVHIVIQRMQADGATQELADLCIGRRSWRVVVGTVGANAIWVDHPSSPMSEELALPLPRSVCMMSLRWVRAGVLLRIIGDSQLLIDCLPSRAHTSCAHILTPIRATHIALLHLARFFHVKEPRAREIAQHTPRADNRAADCAANRASDTGDYREQLDDEIRRMAHMCLNLQGASDMGILVSFDGASRGNPGLAAYGVCMWWGFGAEGEFHSKGMLSSRKRIGITTNKVAKAAYGLANTMIYIYIYP